MGEVVYVIAIRTNAPSDVGPCDRDEFPISLYMHSLHGLHSLHEKFHQTYQCSQMRCGQYLAIVYRQCYDTIKFTTKSTFVCKS